MKIFKLTIILIMFILYSKISLAQPNDSTNNVFEQLVLNKHWVLDTFNYDGIDTIFIEDTALWRHGDLEFKLVNGKRYHKYFHKDTLLIFDSTDTDLEWQFDSTGTHLKGIIGVFSRDPLSPVGINYTLIGPQLNNEILLLTSSKLWLRQVDHRNKTIIAKFRVK